MTTAERADLIAKVRARPHNRRTGPHADGSKPEGGFACRCRWNAAYHGDICPEHGYEGTVDRDDADWLADEVERLTAAVHELEELTSDAEGRANELACKLHEARAEVERLEEEARRFYRADGTFTLLSSPEEAVEARIACARMIQQFQSDNQPRS